MIKKKNLIIQLPDTKLRSLIDTFMEVVKPITAEIYDCPFRGNFFHRNIWDFSGYHHFDAKAERRDFFDESSIRSEQLSFKNFTEEIKSLATVKYSFSAETSNY